MVVLWFLPCNSPHLSEQSKEQLTFLIHEATEAGVPADFCIYLWQSHCRNSVIHFKHIIILRSQLSWKWKSPRCGGPAVLTLQAQHVASTAETQQRGQHREPVATSASAEEQHSCCSDRKRISRLPYTVSACKFCVYSPLLVKSVLVVLAVPGNEWALARKAWTVACDSVKLSYQ